MLIEVTKITPLLIICLFSGTLLGAAVMALCNISSTYNREIEEELFLNNKKIKVKKLNEKAKSPHRGSDYAAGYDLYACTDEPCVIAPHTTKKIGTGLSIEIPHGYFGAVFARSGLATKSGLRPANCVGVCDEDYRGEYIVALHNDTDEEKIINPNDRIAQLIMLPYLASDFEECDDLSDTKRGSGGFGSSGVQ